MEVGFGRSGEACNRPRLCKNAGLKPLTEESFRVPTGRHARQSARLAIYWPGQRSLRGSDCVFTQPAPLSDFRNVRLAQATHPPRMRPRLKAFVDRSSGVWPCQGRRGASPRRGRQRRSLTRPDARASSPSRFQGAASPLAEDGRGWALHIFRTVIPALVAGTPGSADGEQQWRAGAPHLCPCGGQRGSRHKGGNDG